ncbi:hypothetical protein [Aquimarina algiphila]|uniref:Uncharacterized protein n=1 Tax=Aquimarina algiphila TaxID=2047982 RepID=A0A554VKH2_9FLAO|nr:hypothetical protein [Aquimarina algiphila]TSE08501.1 hypothetical protein FOF46_12070 [Aquimarina algiphila]
MNSSIKKIKSPSYLHLFLFIFLIASSTTLFAQKEELWFGTYTDDNGKILQGRYNIIKKGRALTSIVLAPYGKSPIKFTVIKNDTIQRFVEISWPNKPHRVATLIQYTDGYYAGNFEDGTKILPIVIKEFNFQDAQLQGNWFKPNEIEVKIIDNTIKLLDFNDDWNKNDNRICNSNDSYSLFCALYTSSISMDGEYRHLRPAVKFVREAIQEKYPKKYDHVLVDFNNAKEITLTELHGVLESAKKNLIAAMKKN